MLGKDKREGKRGKDGHGMGERKRVVFWKKRNKFRGSGEKEGAWLEEMEGRERNRERRDGRK